MKSIKGSLSFFVVALILFAAPPSQAAVAPLPLQKSIDAARRDFQTRIGGSREIFTLVFIDASPLLAAHSHRLASGRALDPASVTLFFANNPVQNTDPMGLQVLDVGNAASWMALNTVQVGIVPPSYFIEFNGTSLVIKDASKNPVFSAEAVSGNPYYYGWSDSNGPTPPAKYRINKIGSNKPMLYDPSWTGQSNPSQQDIEYNQAHWGKGRVLLQKNDDHSKFYGRIGMYLHGGGSNPKIPYTQGCVKVSDADWTTIIDEYLKKNKDTFIPFKVEYPAGGIYKENVP